MVFMVKLPARGASRGASQAAPGGPPPTHAPGTVDTLPADLAAASAPADDAAAAPGAPTTPAPPTTPAGPPPLPAVPGAQAALLAQPTPVHEVGKACTVDVLLAPSVLRHRYVRGVDKSSIVERPERIRAVLLGVAAVYGLWEPARAAHAHAETPETPETPDELAAMLAGMDVNRPSAAPAAPALRTLLAEKTVPLDASHPALAFVHAHAHEPASYTTTTAYGGAQAPCGATHLERLVQLGATAPHAPPGQVEHRAAAGSDDSSSDGEGDARMHPSEIPAELHQGDLYLCGPHTAGAQDTQDGGSREAISHALGASIEAVDRVVAAAHAVPPTLYAAELVPAAAGALAALPPLRRTPQIPAKRAFVLTRPPGHHCGGADPQGFCWVNNAVVAAAHAHAAHGIDRVIVLDIDLHHGNGTQSLAWRINAEAHEANAARAARLAALRRAPRGRKAEKRATYAQYLEDEALVGPRPLQICYASVHDIDSYPCEGGDMELVRNASVCLAGAHGQWIWNVHLETHRDQAECDALYTAKYGALLHIARRFAQETQAHAPRTLVLVSCGFDACTYEYPGMQRHGKHVPPAFYARFAHDAAQLAEEVADGKLISLLEGGYSDRALTSGALAHVGALANGNTLSPAPWSLENLAHLERMGKRTCAAASQATAPASAGRRRTAAAPPWLVRASEHFAAFQQACGVEARPLEPPAAPGTARTLARGLLRDLDALDTPSKATTGGHALRDRSVLRTRSQHNLQATATATATATPGRVRTRPPPPPLPPGPKAAAAHASEAPCHKPHTPPLADRPPAAATPGVDLANWVPGALPVESVPSTPAKPPTSSAP